MVKADMYGIILAGGVGSRFWPLSRAQYPKQVLRLLGSQSMLQSTIARLLPRMPPAHLAVVTNAAQAGLIHQELERQGWQAIRVWAEPQGRNTAAAVGLAAALLAQEAPQGLMAVFPADHYIRDGQALLDALETGAALAQEGYLVTFGIPPHRPETGYGYIKQGAPVAADRGRTYEVQRFIEKPPLPKARAFLAEGGYYWNSGIFLFRRDVIWQALAQHLPELHQGLSRLLAGEPRPSLAEVYDALPGISLDHGIMEKAQRVAVVPVDMGWNDVGTWEALHEIFPPDAHGNVMLGKKTLDMGSRDSLIYAHDRLVATIGLDRLMVVDTPDATLVCHRDRVQEVKDLVAELARQNMVESIYHPTVERPWGRYTVMDEGWSYKVKRIEVDPGKRLSLQMHRQRAEHWVAVAGAALVTLGEQIRPLTANQSIYIPPQTAHRLENPHAEPFMLIEVQTGAYLGEDDIIRLEHDYWQPEEV